MTAGNAGMFPHLPSRGHRTGAALAPLCPMTPSRFLEIAIPSSATAKKSCIFSHLSQDAQIVASWEVNSALLPRGHLTHDTNGAENFSSRGTAPTIEDGRQPIIEKWTQIDDVEWGEKG